MPLVRKTGEVKFQITGPLVYPAGEYDDNVTYTRTTLAAPVVLYDTQYYILNKKGSFKGINPKTDYAANGAKATWIRMDQMKYAFIEILMANYAKLASAVFYGDYMFSQHGKDASGNDTVDFGTFDPSKLGDKDCPFTPNLMLDFLLGKFVGLDVDIKGRVETSKDGQRIVISPEDKDIKIFDKNDKNVITIEGNEYQNIDSLYSQATPEFTIKNIPLIYPKNIFKYEADVTDSFHVSGTIKGTSSITGMIQASAYMRSYTVRLKAKKYSDSNLQNLVADYSLDSYTSGLIMSQIKLDSDFILEEGYYILYLSMETTSYISYDQVFRIDTFRLSFFMKEYLSKIFANGISFGTASNNTFSFIDRAPTAGETDSNMIGMISNERAGLNLKRDVLLVKKREKWGIAPSTVCYGWASVTPAGATFQRVETWDNNYLEIKRNGIGRVIITFPEAWRGIINYSSAYVMITGIGSAVGAETSESAIKGTFYAWQGNGFIVALSDDSTNNDGDFFFEVKLY